MRGKANVPVTGRDVAEVVLADQVRHDSASQRRERKASASQRPNLRPLAVITADIYKSERQNLFTIGKLLLEAKEQVGHGKWLPYLKSIGWHDRSAQAAMAVARLVVKYATVADLDAAPTALYRLVWLAEHGDEHVSKSLPLAIERLKKSVARGDSAGQQWEVVNLSHYTMAHPKATELALKAASDAINQNCFGDTKRYAAMMAQGKAIIEANPKTEKELKAVTTQYPIPFGSYANQDDIPVDVKGRIIMGADDEDEAEEEEAEEETAPATELPPRQRALVGKFNDACAELLPLASKASTVFLHSDVTVDDLDMLGNFLKQIAASKKKAVQS